MGIVLIHFQRTRVWLAARDDASGKTEHAIDLRPAGPPRMRCHAFVTFLSPGRNCRNLGFGITKTRVMAKILVVDDEPDAVELVEFNLKSAGYEVVTAADGSEALKKARAHSPDLIVLDLMLPEVDGLEVCKILRRDPATSAIPIIMVAAKAAGIDRVLGLGMGADDYITKPVSPPGPVFRVKNLMKRGQGEDEKKDRYQLGELVIDVPRHLVTVQGKRV